MYKCVTPCFFDNRYWSRGAVWYGDSEPNQYFVAVTEEAVEEEEKPKRKGRKKDYIAEEV